MAVVTVFWPTIREPKIIKHDFPVSSWDPSESMAHHILCTAAAKLNCLERSCDELWSFSHRCKCNSPLSQLGRLLVMVFLKSNFCVETLHNSPHLCWPPCEGKVICARACEAMDPAVAIDLLETVAPLVDWSCNAGGDSCHSWQGQQLLHIVSKNVDAKGWVVMTTLLGNHQRKPATTGWLSTLSVGWSRARKSKGSYQLLPCFRKQTRGLTHIPKVLPFPTNPWKSTESQACVKCIAASQWQSFWRRLCSFIQGNGYAL